MNPTIGTIFLSARQAMATNKIEKESKWSIPNQIVILLMPINLPEYVTAVRATLIPAKIKPRLMLEWERLHEMPEIKINSAAK